MKKILVITYYWPPSGGSGVQRWLYFAKYLPEFGINPVVITVDPEFASYKFIDESLQSKVPDVEVIRTKSSEPFNMYSKLIGKSKEEAIPQAFTGESDPGTLQKISRFVRGNFFIPDARKGWINYAYEAAKKIILSDKIDVVITTGPPHSTHLAGLKLKEHFKIKWIADFRDPWTEVFYNKLFYRTRWADNHDRFLEKKVLQNADKVLTIGPTMAELLKQRLDNKPDENKIDFIYNGYDHEIFRKLLPKTRNNKFIICHLGILSDNQPVDGFISAMIKFLKQPDISEKNIQLLLIGKIAPLILEKIRTQLPSLDVDVRNYMPHQDAMQQIVNSDLLFNSLAEVENGKYLISGKLVEYIATGNPILCLGTPGGDIDHLLQKYENSKIFDRKSTEEIFNFIYNIYNKWKTDDKTVNNINLNEELSRKKMTEKLSVMLKDISPTLNNN